MKKVIAIVGPTASGKTGIGVRLAKEFDGEIVSADSRQVYRGLDLGTGKDLSEYRGVKYHLIDIVDPEEKMTLFDYLPLARAAIDDILSRGKLPIIVGGTGLYVQGLVEGFTLEPISDCHSREGGNPDALDSGSPVRQARDLTAITNQISNTKSQMSVIPAEAGILKIPGRARDDKKQYPRELLNDLTIQQLNDTLQKLDPGKYETVDHKNRHRLIRAIEMAQEGLKPTKKKPDFEVLQIGIDIPRAELHQRIDKRVDERFEQGMLDEVEGLIKSGVSTDWLQGLGLEYREITQFVLGESYNVLRNQNPPNTLYEIRNTAEFQVMAQRLKFRIHQFARRQMTWFRRFPEINWLSNYDEMKRFVKIFLEH